MNDQELIHELRLRNESAFRWLVENYRNRVYSAVLNIVQNTADAEDAAQETFIQVFESIGKFKEDASLSTWIFKIAVRKAIDKLRATKTRKKLQLFLPWWMPEENKNNEIAFLHPGIIAEHKEKAAVIFKVIKSLPEKQQLAFTLIRIQGMSYEEVCGIMNQKTKAVESLVSRAKYNIEKGLEKYYKN